MKYILRNLRLDNARRCSGNVWWCSLAIFFVMGANFNKAPHPLLTLVIPTFIIVLYSLVSWLGYVWWTAASWGERSADARVGGALQFVAVCVAELIICWLAYNILCSSFNYPGGLNF